MSKVPSLRLWSSEILNREALVVRMEKEGRKKRRKKEGKEGKKGREEGKKRTKSQKKEGFEKMIYLS
jgi:hypothetical protein